MKLGITLKKTAYTPEAFAYQKYLVEKGWDVQLALECDLDPFNDINIYFMGTRPIWKKKYVKAIEVHEYQSLSVPPYSKLKDLVKKNINSKPQGRIFLNDFVRNKIGFQDNVPYIERDMGVDEKFFQSALERRDTQQCCYDIVYSGSIDNRVGLIEVIIKLSRIGFSILLIGSISDENKARLARLSNVEILGVVSYGQLAGLYKKARYGLNFTPDIYPYNMQTSTKTLEYLASGLRLITNHYCWIDSFCRAYEYTPIFLEQVLLEEKIEWRNDKEIPNIIHLSWNNILEGSGLDKFMKDLLYKYG